MTESEMTLNQLYMGPIDTRSSTLIEWFAKQGYLLDFDDYRSERRHRITVKVFDQGAVIVTVIKWFWNSELRGFHWLGEILHLAHNQVLDGVTSR